ncbi:MAG: class I SAM-dependent methyltransferase [Roseibium sp.]|uniref:class I SAM-dependent methyltransferase n=1 Tax=Roseibium sp. TaxID=1936156 RepID=UPI003D9C0BB0
MTAIELDLNRKFDEIETAAKSSETVTFATSSGFRRSLFELVATSPENGPVVEVGCYTGGSSIFLAKACELSGRKLFVVDISEEFLQITKRNIGRVCRVDPTTYFRGTARDFFSGNDLAEPPLLIFIDADHSYRAVREDIQAAKLCNPETRYWAFHDYSLRGTAPERSNIAVDRAIHDEFGQVDPLQRIGIQIGPKSEPNAGGDYFAENGTEGVLFSSKDVQVAIGGDDADTSHRPSTVHATRAPLPLENMNWADYLLTDASAFDIALQNYFGGLEIPNPHIRQFLTRWYEGGVPSRIKLAEILSTPSLRQFYFADFGSMIRSLDEKAQREVFSTCQSYNVMSVLNDQLLNAIGLSAFRADYIDGQIRENRRKSVSQILNTGLGPQTSADTKRFFDNLESFEQNGFVALSVEPKTSKDALFHELSDSMLMTKEHLAKVDGDTLLYRKGLNSKETPEAISILNSRKFLPLFSLICGHPIKPIPAYAEFVHQGGGDPNATDSNKLWHMDTFHPTFKWWSFFKGVKKELGPFMYYPGSNVLTAKKLLWLSLYAFHKSMNVKMGDVALSPRIEDTDLDFLEAGAPRAFDVPELTLVIADTGGIHRRSEPSEPGLVRRSLFGWARHELV